MNVKRRVLTQAVLASTLYCFGASSHAVLVSVTGPTNAIDDLSGYTFQDNNLTLDVVDNSNIAGTIIGGVLHSIDNYANPGVLCNVITGCTNSTAQFAGNATVQGQVGTTHPINKILIDGAAGKTVAFQGNIFVDTGNFVFTSTGTATLANNVTLTGNVDSQNVNQGILSFLGNGTVTGTIGATKGLNKVNLDGVGTVNFNKSLFNGTKLNFNADATVNIADGASLFSVNNELGAAAKGTLNFLGTSTVGDIGATFGLNAITISGDNKTVSIFGNVGNNTPIIFKANGIVSIADGRTIDDVDNTTGGLAGILKFEGSGSAEDIGATTTLSKIELNTSNGAAKTVTITGATLKADSIVFSGANATTLALNKNGMIVTGAITANSSGVHTVQIKDNTTINRNIGSSAALIKTALDAGKTLTVGSNASLFGTVDGAGTLTFSGNTNITSAIGGTTPLTAVNFNGTVGRVANLDANISAGAVTINNGGTLKVNSTNTITSNLTVANGNLSLAPNANLNVTGPFTLNNNNATLTVDMNGAASSTPRVAATGVATVGVVGGKLTVLNPAYVPGTLTVPVVTGGGGSALAPLTITNANTFMTSFSNQVSGNTLNLVLTSKSLSGLANQTNNTGPALALNSLAASGANVTGDLKNILNQINTFNDAASINYALSTLSPTVNGAVLNESFMAQSETFDAITDHFDTQAFWQKHYGKSSSGMSNGDTQTPSSAWVKVFKQYGNQAEREDILGYKNDTWGIIAGGDAYVKENILVGLALSWANLDIDDKRSVYEKNQANSYQASVYANLECDTPWYYNGMLAVAYNEYRSDRNIVFGNVNLFPHADYDGWQMGAKVESGYVYDFDTIQFVPHTSLFYSHLSLNSYTETGANTAGLAVDEADFEAMLWGGGFKFIKEMALENERFFQAETHTRVFYDLLGDTMALTSQFTGGGPNFRTAGFSPARFSYNVGGNVSLYSRHNWVFTVSYDYDAKADYHANAGFLRIRHEF